MGVPKFFRWISERYPNISRIVNDNQIPDFDNFYLDMNGIIHACSHANEDKSETKITEYEIFRHIFHYIDFLFRLIKPRKVFFMAVDGVAPRAKMNQQRSRRFRAGQERVKKLRKFAKIHEETYEHIETEYFDTNSITPGTPFMIKLQQQLEYFVHVKMTTDPLWENVDVHLSGHLTPGEGEHKIMDFIRYTRSQTGYNVNTRHCLYGLDADLIMLSLVTHETHFTLLREQVVYGSKKVSKILSPDEITWHLFHSSLLRDYIDLEFRSLRSQLKFKYELDKIIDDWILMAYLVGNDFIPHLPHFHINEDALTILWDTYKRILPNFDGYMNEFGDLNLERFQIYITELSKYDHQRYADVNDTFRNIGKFNRKSKNLEKEKKKNDDNDGTFDFAILDKLNIPKDAKSTPKEKVVQSTERKPLNLPQTPDGNDINDGDDDDDDDDDNSDSDLLSEKSLDDERENTTKPIDDLDKMPLIEAEFRQHKNHYYREKMKIIDVTNEQLKIYVEQYILAIQWILKYYYQGCPSWSWFYPFHYAPYLSDLKDFKDYEYKFDKGKPFKPYEQLLSVLPPSSRSLLPIPLQELMIASDSPLIQFYPEHFQLDQNEKKHDWEAIVLLPFIDEKLLLDTIELHYAKLDENQIKCNQHLPSTCFHTTNSLQPVDSLIGNNPYFPAIEQTRAACRTYSMDHFRPDNFQYKFGQFDTNELVHFPKFPILNVLPYQYDYKKGAVFIFETCARDPTLVLNLTHRPDQDCIKYNDNWKPSIENLSPPFEITNIKRLVQRYLGRTIFFEWPYFQYGIVCGICDYENFYTWSNIPGGSNLSSLPVDDETNVNNRKFVQNPVYMTDQIFEILNPNDSIAKYNRFPLNDNEKELEYRKALSINEMYGKRQGISIGPIPILLYICPLIGYRVNCSSDTGKCQTIMCFSNESFAYAIQTTLFKLPNYKFDSDECPKTIFEHFKINDPVFIMKQYYYAKKAFVQEIIRDNEGKYLVSCQIDMSDIGTKCDIHRMEKKLREKQLQYYTAQQVADKLKVSACVIAKLTGNLKITGKKKRRRIAIKPLNIGLSLKCNRPIKFTHGYTKKCDDTWFYSDATIQILAEYISKFPEIIAEIEKRPNDETYIESNIWPQNNQKRKLPEIRQWIKSLPTHKTEMIDADAIVLDAPLVNEIENIVNSFYSKSSTKTINEKSKIVQFYPNQLFKPDGIFDKCQPDPETTFSIFDRVVNVHSSTGVPIGSHGTVVGILPGRRIIDAYYEILFDKLPKTNFNAILLDKPSQKCRIKVRSYQIINYTHSLRIRSYEPNRSTFMGSHFQGQNYSQHRNVPNYRHQPKSTPPTTYDRELQTIRTDENNRSTQIHQLRHSLSTGEQQNMQHTYQSFAIPKPMSEPLLARQIVNVSTNPTHPYSDVHQPTVFLDPNLPQPVYNVPRNLYEIPPHHIPHTQSTDQFSSEHNIPIDSRRSDGSSKFPISTESPSMTPPVHLNVDAPEFIPSGEFYQNPLSK